MTESVGTSTSAASAKSSALGGSLPRAAQIARLTPAQRAKVEDALCAAVANGATDKRIATVAPALIGVLAQLNQASAAPIADGLVADSAQEEVLKELRTLIHEIRSDRQSWVV